MPAATAADRLPRAVVFDVDGTLYETGRLRRRMAAQLAAHCLGRPRDLGLPRILYWFRRCREELAEEEALGVSRLQYERPSARLGVPPRRVEAVVRDWMLERPLPHLAACRRPGAQRLFALLRAAGRPIGVLSDYPVEAKLAALGLAADAAVSTVDPAVDRLKPHPAGLELLLERLGTSAAQTVVIGDRDDRDGECARRCGCSFLILGKRLVASTAADLGTLLARWQAGR